MANAKTLAATHGTLSKTTIEGQTLRDVCLLCYGRDDDDYRLILTDLNNRVDWDYLPVTTISYLSPDVVEKFWLK